MKKTALIFYIIIILSAYTKAQEKDYGIWTTISLEKKIKKLDIELNSELRTFNNSQDINRLSFQLDASYKIYFLKLGLGYQFIYFNDIKYNDYQPRQRYIAYLIGKKSYKNFTFSIRERFQRTIKDERDRIRIDGSYDTYKVNPEWEWRNKIKISYNSKNTPIITSLSFESFYCLNDPDNKFFNELRYSLDLDYRLSKKHTISIYGLIDKEINVTNPLTRYITGIAYKYSF